MGKTLDVIKETQARTDAPNMIESNTQVYPGICKWQVLRLWEHYFYYTKHDYCDYQRPLHTFILVSFPGCGFAVGQA